MILLTRFGTRYGERTVVYSNPGCDFECDYSPYYSDSGSLELEITGQRNAFEDIQLYKDECDVHSILRRYAAGELDVLQRVQGFFGDITDFPTSYPEMFNLINRSQSFFDSLPADVKAKFGNDFQQFLAASQSPDFLSAFVAQTVAEPPAVQSDKDDADES